MSQAEPPSTLRIGLILTVGMLAVSTSAILVRLANATTGISGVGFSLVLAASRLTLAAIVLLPTWHKIQHNLPTVRAAGFACAAGMVLAVHFATWITSLSFTSIAASTALVTTNPIWVAILSWLWLREQPKRLTLIGIGIALVGGVLIGWGGSSSGQGGNNPLLGDALALIGAWTVSLYLLLGRAAQQQGLSLGRYVAIAYTLAAIVLLPLPLLLQTPYRGYPPQTYGLIGLMALLPQLIGHTSFNWAVRWVSPTLVSLVILIEPIAASLLGYWLFGEVPGLLVLAGAGVLLLGVGVAAVGTHSADLPSP